MNEEKFKKIIKWSIVGAIAVGIVVEAYLIYMLSQESRFSSLYLVPGSYSNYIQNGTISFTYGAECYEGQKTNYHLNIFIGNKKIGERNFVLCNPRRKLEESIEIKGIYREGLKFPVKLRLVLTYDNGTNEVHFWIKGIEESNRSG